MSTRHLSLSYQIDRTWNSPRRLVVIAALLMAITAVTFAVTAQAVQESHIEWQQGVTIAPDGWEAGYCPGDVLTYPVSVKYDRYPSTVHVTEGWYQVGGAVWRSTLSEWTIPIMGPVDVTTTGLRTVPSLPPGEWELWHTAVEGEEANVTGYIVGPVRIKEGCE